MLKNVKNRLLYSILSLLSVGIGVWIVLYNLEDNIVFFYPPSEIHKIQHYKDVRVGGLVKTGSINKISSNAFVFIITDGKNDLLISYNGMLPALFREGQGIVARGHLEKKQFIATELLAKHDENYKPPILNEKP